jgi:glutamate racemase
MSSGDASRSQPQPDSPIGVFDSGLGGLTVVGELQSAMPNEEIVYLGDTARVPYGTKSLQTIRRFSLEDAAFLLEFSPKMIVVACNSASAAAVDVLRERLPVDVVDVIRPSAARAVTAAPGTIGVIGTEATVNSGAYQRAIHALDPAREVAAFACPLLVPIVEEGRDQTDPIVTHVLCDYLRELQRIRPTVLILGCTHYPLLSGAIGKLMGPATPLINSGWAAAQETVVRLESAGLRSRRQEQGTLRCFTTDNAQRFAAVARRFGTARIDKVEYVGTDVLETHRLPEGIAP